MGLGLAPHVNHMRGAAFVEMGQFLGHNGSSFPTPGHHSSRPVSLVIARIVALSLAVALALPARAQGLPDLGDISSRAISENQERTIGNRIMRDIRADPVYVDDPEVADYITGLGKRLMSVADVPRKDVTYFVLREDTINAFALVGGHIGMHTGLFMLTQNESELAGVMSHEIAHILQKHQARSIAGQSRASWATLAALAVAVLATKATSRDSGQVVEAAATAATAYQIQNMLDYTREHEREADRVGLTLLERAGFDPNGMSAFFERLMRANRLNEFKGAPSYLRTHPLTTERIADMQDRTPQAVFRVGRADPFEYRLVRERLRAMNGSPAEAVNLFRAELEQKGVVRPREDVYGLAVAQRRARDLDGALKTLEPLRKLDSHPAFERLAGQILADQGRTEDALGVYRAALKSYPDSRALAQGYAELLVDKGRHKEALADLDESLRRHPEDARLYEIQARAYEATGRPLSQHRSQAEAQFRRGNLAAAVQQLDWAVRLKGNDYYEQSSAEARLRELRGLLENEREAEKALKIS
jgi:predicted Zn-dependent protease